MPITNKVVCGTEVVLDLSQDGLSQSKQLQQGIIAHTKSGEQITGTGITPSGDISITENGDYDISQYSTSTVNVQGEVPSSLEYCVQGNLSKGNCTHYHLNENEDIVRRYMFAGQTALTEIDNIDKKTFLRANCFKDCTSLVNIPVKNGVKVESPTLGTGAYQKFASFGDLLFWTRYSYSMASIYYSQKETGSPSKEFIGSINLDDPTCYIYLSVEGIRYRVIFTSYNVDDQFIMSWVVVTEEETEGDEETSG